VPENSEDVNTPSARTLGVLAEPEVTAEFAERNGREVGHLLNLADPETRLNLHVATRAWRLRPHGAPFHVP